MIIIIKKLLGFKTIVLIQIMLMSGVGKMTNIAEMRSLRDQKTGQECIAELRFSIE